jgi:solute carrier family 25 S-adenosylmethionine transporter 26
MDPKSRSQWVVSGVSGGIAGITVDVVLFPLDTLKTRLQSVEGFARAGAFTGIYRGLLSAALGSAPAGIPPTPKLSSLSLKICMFLLAAAFFATYDTVRFGLTSRVDSKYHTLCYMLAATSGECVSYHSNNPVRLEVIVV